MILIGEGLFCGRLRPSDYGPGLFLLIPVVDRMIRVSLRTVERDWPRARAWLQKELGSTAPPGSAR